MAKNYALQHIIVRNRRTEEGHAPSADFDPWKSSLDVSKSSPSCPLAPDRYARKDEIKVKSSRAPPE